jgi:copper ion binding protein
MATREIVVNIDGMSCGGCAGHVRDMLVGLRGVQSAAVDHIAKRAKLTVTGDFEGIAAIRRALDGTKFVLMEEEKPPPPPQEVVIVPAAPVRDDGDDERRRLLSTVDPTAPHYGGIGDAAPYVRVSIADDAGTAATAATTAVLRITGMTCASCVARVSSAIREIPGVSAANVNLLACTASVSFDPAVTGLRRIIDAVAETGYAASPMPTDRDSKRKALAHVQEIAYYRRRFLIALFFAVPLVVMMILELIPNTAEKIVHAVVFRGVQVHGLVGLVLATPV